MGPYLYYIPYYIGYFMVTQAALRILMRTCTLKTVTWALGRREWMNIRCACSIMMPHFAFCRARRRNQMKHFLYAAIATAGQSRVFSTSNTLDLEQRQVSQPAVSFLVCLVVDGRSSAPTKWLCEHIFVSTCNRCTQTGPIPNLVRFSIFRI